MAPKKNHVDPSMSSGSSPTFSSIPAVEPLLLDIHGAARALSATPWAVRSLLWDGKIPFVKIGRRFLVDPADLRAYIAREKSRGAA